MTQLDRLVWAVQHTYQVGSLYQGVRSSDVPYGEAVGEALSDHLRPGLEAPPNYSIQLPGPERQFAALYHRHHAVVRTTDVSRLTWALFHHLGSHLDRSSVMALAFGVVVRGNRAVLTPPTVSTLPRRLASRLWEAGGAFYDAPWVEVDFQLGEVVISEPALTIDVRPVQQWLRGDGLGANVSAGRYELTAILLDADPVMAGSRLASIARVLRRARDLRAYSPERAISELLDLTAEIPIRSVESRARGLADAIAAALS